MPPPSQNSEVSLAIHRCLSSDPTKRPTATELRAVLSGRMSGREAILRQAFPPILAGHTEARELITANSLELRHSDGGSLRIGVKTELTRSLMQQLGPDAHFWDNRQCLLDRNEQGQWTLSPLGATVNETLLNGAAISGPVLLHNGDTIAVGREAKGIIKMPLCSARPMT